MKSLRVVALCAPLLTGAAGAQTIGIVTTPAGSFSNSAGQAIAKVLVERAKLRAIVQAQASTGFEEVESGSADFNVSNSFDATFYSTGTGEYEGRGRQPAMRYVGSLIPYRVAMHVRADSRINSITDLKGKRVSSEFNAQKTIARIIEAHLANAGLTWKDVNGVPSPNVVRQAEDFMSGKVDVMFFALGSACFLIGPFPGYAQLVGASADAVTFFIGSILFTAGGAMQTWLAFGERHAQVGELAQHR